jgi:unsaturated rhamnogalacturonyl hydrolase
MKLKKSFLVIFFLLFAVLSKAQTNSPASVQESLPFSPALTQSDVKTVLKAVADWQINTPLKHEPGDWTNGALYAGMVDWAGISGSDTYYDWLRGLSDKMKWTYFIHGNPLRRYHADDYCVGQMYVEMYRKYNDKNMIKPIRAYLDQMIKDPAKGDLKFVNTKEYWATQRWSWCDALFMGPTVWAKIGNVTHKNKYFNFMYGEYKASTDYLYSKEDSLYFRDSSYFTRKEANGDKVFWGRGNGWVFAGLPIIIRELPAKYEHRDYFTGIYKAMAAKLVSLQQPDGSWHASLLDPASYPNPEMSATAFFVFGIAWGIDNGYLDKEKYLPSVVKGWKAMVTAVWPDGKVGFIQPIGADPKAVTREMTEVYGIGGFLMAGTEIYKMIGKGLIK